MDGSLNGVNICNANVVAATNILVRISVYSKNGRRAIETRGTPRRPISVSEFLLRRLFAVARNLLLLKIFIVHILAQTHYINIYKPRAHPLPKWIKNKEKSKEEEGGF